MQNKPYFFSGNRGSQKGGRGGPTFEKNSPKIPFFFGVASLIIMDVIIVLIIRIIIVVIFVVIFIISIISTLTFVLTLIIFIILNNFHPRQRPGSGAFANLGLVEDCDYVVKL